MYSKSGEKILFWPAIFIYGLHFVMTCLIVNSTRERPRRRWSGVATKMTFTLSRGGGEVDSVPVLRLTQWSRVCHVRGKWLTRHQRVQYFNFIAAIVRNYRLFRWSTTGRRVEPYCFYRNASTFADMYILEKRDYYLVDEDMTRVSRDQ